MAYSVQLKLKHSAKVFIVEGYNFLKRVGTEVDISKMIIPVVMPSGAADALIIFDS